MIYKFKTKQTDIGFDFDVEFEKNQKIYCIIGKTQLLEIGNFRQFDTYTNDKSWIFQNKTLGNLSTKNQIPPFTYERIIKESARFIDVIWFNNRGFPSSIFEVEHSTDFRGALIKFTELQDFKTNFYCISDESKRKKYLLNTF